MSCHARYAALGRTHLQGLFLLLLVMWTVMCFLYLAGHSSSYMLSLWAGRGCQFDMAGEGSDGFMLSNCLPCRKGMLSVFVGESLAYFNIQIICSFVPLLHWLSSDRAIGPFTHLTIDGLQKLEDFMEFAMIYMTIDEFGCV